MANPQPYATAVVLTLPDKLARLPWLMLLGMTVLAAIGVAQLFSVADGSFQPWAERHALRFMFGLALIAAMALVPLGFWAGLAYPLYAVALVLLALVPVIGFEAMGAKRWLGTQAFGFQPSEVMKVALVAALARYYQWLPQRRVSRPLFVIVPLAMIALPVLLTLKQPDLGTAAMLAAVGLAMIFLAGVNLAYFVSGAVAVAIALPMVWGHLHDYQRRRIEVFLNPDSAPLSAGYHITQSKIALASGGFMGRGFQQGTQAQLDFLPEKHTDFILTMLAEEWGFVGAVTVLGLYAVLLVMLLAMALRCQSRFARLLIAGHATVLALYVFVNVGMVTGLIPVVGVPLPLVSYGGTAMITLMVGWGLATSAYVHRHRQFAEGDLSALI